MKDNKVLQVRYKNEPVGRLALNNTGKAAFQYDKKWLKNGFPISPFSLPLKEDVFVPSTYNFNGLFGVFDDSLPDSWGRLVLDRMLKNNGINPAEISVLDRLAIVGASGMGALEYLPEYRLPNSDTSLSIDELAEESRKLLECKDCSKINELFKGCGSSGGARPKALIKIDGEDWIVKFHYSLDGDDSGITEYGYSLAAKKCGINMPETRLLPSENSPGYFAVKRFDRPKKHMISAAALLEIDFERSLTDYSDLFKLTNIVTNGNKEDLKDLFRRMSFNVWAENQDDHLKNFAYLYDDIPGIWRLSPAYDLTHQISGYGEHTTTINGKGKDITDADLIAVGIKAGLAKDFCKAANDAIKSICKELVNYD